MLADIIAIVELVTKWKDTHASSSRQIQENIIEPIWNIFATIHNNYKETFLDYLKLLDDGEKISTIREKIALDSIHSQDLRTSLTQLINEAQNLYTKSYDTDIPLNLGTVNLSRSRIDFEPIDYFIGCIEYYFHLMRNDGRYTTSNAARHRLIFKSYSDEPAEEVRRIMRNETIKTIQYLQDAYGRCFTAYRNLKDI